jgi:hypothetical protein
MFVATGRISLTACSTSRSGGDNGFWGSERYSLRKVTTNFAPSANCASKYHHS